MTLNPSQDRWRARLAGWIVLVAVVLGALETLQQHAFNAVREATTPFGTTVLNTFVPWLLILPFLPLIAGLAFRWPLDQGRWRRTLWIHVLATLLFVAVHEWFTAILYHGIYRESQVKVFLYWWKLVTFRLAVDALIYWGIVGVVHAVRATREAREREQTAARLEASLSEARLMALREQLRPHFLFNSLNAVSTLALRGEGERVTQALSTLSDLLRMSLETERAQEQPLAEELAFLDRYLELQQLRFGDRLTVHRRVDDSALDAAIPVMLTQPVVENAFRHGIERVPGQGRIELSFKRTSDQLVIEVQDSGPGFGRGAGNGEGIGLANTRARLAAAYGDRARIECGDAPGGGGLVTIVLPYRSLPIPTPAPGIPPQ